MSILGGIGTLMSVITIIGDMSEGGFLSYHYTYTPPLTGHEIFMIMLMIISLATLIIGILSVLKNRDSVE